MGAVDAGGPMPAEQCRGLLASLAEGLADIDAHGICHRDLKPQNVILSATGPQLVDFGLAQDAADTRLTRADIIVGTPGYIAPELLTDNELTSAADVFALRAPTVDGSVPDPDQDPAGAEAQPAGPARADPLRDSAAGEDGDQRRRPLHPDAGRRRRRHPGARRRLFRLGRSALDGHPGRRPDVGDRGGDRCLDIGRTWAPTSATGSSCGAATLGARSCGCRSGTARCSTRGPAGA
jgi:hypothetical protein